MIRNTDRSLVETPGETAALNRVPPLPTSWSGDASGGIVPARSEAELGPFPVPWRHPIRSAWWLIRMLFGLVSLVLLLAVVAAVPVLNFVALGYMLEAEGAVARTGRLRDAFPLSRVAPRVGSIALGVFLWLIPLQILAGRVADARIIDTTGASAARLELFRLILGGLIALHLCLSLARGGALSCFFRPLRNLLWLRRRLREGDYWPAAHGHVLDFASQLRFRHHFLLGLKGAAGAMIWLLIPTALYAFYTVPERANPGAVLVTVLGAAMLVLVFMWLPFLQARLAAENRFLAVFEVREIRRLFRRAPISWLLAAVLVFVLALPLYVTKVRLLPQDAMWLITAVFIVTMYPARIATGWAYHRATHRSEDAWFGFRWMSRMALIPLLSVYVFLIFFSQAIGEHGKAGLFEHHAFLLPVPF